MEKRGKKVLQAALDELDLQGKKVNLILKID